MDRIRPVEKKPPRDRPCFESHGDGMWCSQCREVQRLLDKDAEAPKKRDPEKLEQIRQTFELLVSNPPLPPSAAQIFGAYRTAVPWLIAEIERWQPLGQALAEAAQQIATQAVEIEKLTAAVETCEARRHKHHG